MEKKMFSPSLKKGCPFLMVLLVLAVLFVVVPMHARADGNTLITDSDNNRVIEVNSSGTIVWQKTGLNNPTDAERLANGNTLIVEGGKNRVIEVNGSGTIVWEKTVFPSPQDAERLANGNTLIVDRGYNRVIEVDSSGTIVWQKTGLSFPHDAERLANGNTLIADYYDRVIEVNSSGTIVWQKTGLDYPLDAERLADGNTLIVDFVNDRVIEVDSSGTIVWQKTGLNNPTDAERLANGNTLIADYGRVIEVNSVGSIVWEKTGLDWPRDAERLLPVSIESGESQTGSVSQGGWAHYQITSIASDIQLLAELTGLSDDVDLYVREGFLPNETQYDCRPYSGGTTPETCTMTNSGATTWYISVHGFSAGNFTITATLIGGTDPGDPCGWGWVYDCAGNCVNPSRAYEYMGDGYCDDGSTGYDLRCDAFSCDGGDCGDVCNGGTDPGDPCGAGKVYDCVGGCVSETQAQSWIGDGYCDDGTWGMDLRCDAFSCDGNDCGDVCNGGGTDPGDPCGAGMVYDCVGGCVSETQAQSWIGDGYCDDGTWGMDLRCDVFNCDGNDCGDVCDGAGTDPGDPCAPGKVYDCVGGCVSETQAQSWIGDGYCDDGTWGMDLRCDAFSNDGGDCGG